MKRNHRKQQEEIWREFNERDSSRSRSREKEGNRGNKNAGRPSKRRISEKHQQAENEENFSQEGKSSDSISHIGEQKPQDNVIDLFVQFFHEVGEPKGLVLAEGERKELISKSAKDQRLAQIPWTLMHEWNKETQIEKLKNVGKLCHMDMEANQNSKLAKVILDVSPIFAQEFTLQLYRLLLNICLIINGEPIIQQRYQSSEISQKQNNQENPILMEFDEPRQLEEVKQMQMKEKPTAMNSDSDIESRLNQLASNVCDNANNNYYLLSFQFKTTKPRHTSKKRIMPEKSARKQAYHKLITQIQNVMKPLLGSDLAQK